MTCPDSLGLRDQVLTIHYLGTVPYRRVKDGWAVPFRGERLKATKPDFDIVDAASGEVLFEAKKKVTPRKINQLLAERRAVFNQVSELTNRVKLQARQG